MSTPTNQQQQLSECKTLVEMLQKSLNACDVDELPDFQIAMLQNLLNNALTATTPAISLDNMQGVIEALTTFRKEKKVVIKYATRIEILVAAQNITTLRSQITDAKEDSTSEGGADSKQT